MNGREEALWIPDLVDANLDVPPARRAVRTEAATRGGEQEVERPFWMKSFDVLAVGTLVVLLALALLWLAAAALLGGVTAWALVPAAVAAVLLADLVSGVVHWIGDRFFAESTPLIGALLIRPFREHHRDPLAITRHGFFELCGNNALAVIVPVLVLLLCGPRPEDGAAALAANGFVVAFALAVFATNQIHKWAHASRCPGVVRALQRAGLILPPAAHARHHRGDFSRGYCVTTGWMNPVLDALRLLPRCERALRGDGPDARRAARPSC